jgi:hypothetical protein
MSLTFSATGAAQTWVVPDRVTSITVDMCGAQGGLSPNSLTNVGRNVPGGMGAKLVSSILVTPGMIITIIVGVMPAASNCGGGGGASWLLVSDSLLAVAGDYIPFNFQIYTITTIRILTITISSIFIIPITIIVISIFTTNIILIIIITIIIINIIIIILLLLLLLLLF